MSKMSRDADPLIDEVRARREALVRRHGGLRGWVKHLQKLQVQKPGKTKPRTRTKAI